MSSSATKASEPESSGVSTTAPEVLAAETTLNPTDSEGPDKKRQKTDEAASPTNEIEEALKQGRSAFQALAKSNGLDYNSVNQFWKVKEGVISKQEKTIQKLEKQLQDEKDKHADTKQKLKAAKKGPTDDVTEDALDGGVGSGKHGAKWKTYYEELKQYKETHGNLNVTKRQNPRLYGWVTCQRTEFRRLKEGRSNNMNPERLQLLNQLNFVWNARQNVPVPFEQRIEQLEAFRAQKGNCDVPQIYPEGVHPQGLGEFVLNMRRQYRQGVLKQERVERLEAMGFQWSLRNRGGTLEERMERHQAKKTGTTSV